METKSQNILQYLSSPHKPLVQHNVDRINNANTRSGSLEWEYSDIRHVEAWDSFNWEDIFHRFGALLDLPLLVPGVIIPLPSGVVQDNYLHVLGEHQLEILLHMTTFTRVNAALQSIHTHLRHHILPPALASVTEHFDKQLAISPGLQYGASKPDLVFHIASDQLQATAFAVGDVKLNAKWSYTRWKSASLDDRIDFRQVLAQINYYMRKRKCRYAMIMTEVELVAVYRIPNCQGALRVSEPFLRMSPENRVNQTSMPADVALLGLALLAQTDVYVEDDQDGSNVPYDDYFPWEPSSSPMASSPPEFPSEYLPTSQRDGDSSQ